VLSARFEVPAPERIRLVVDDADARYPLMIDPLLTETADTLLESNQASSELGISVASAGDVNDDGFDDVIVGANAYDAGQSDEGAAFVFLGAQTESRTRVRGVRKRSWSRIRRAPGWVLASRARAT
jgi:hypothetical protein